MKTITSQEFAKKYGTESLSAFDSGQKVTSKVEDAPLTEIVGQDIANRVDRVGDILARPNTGPVTKAAQVFGQGAGLAANTLEQTAMKVPGVKQVMEGIGEGINWLTTSDMSPVKALGELIGDSKTLQTAVRLYDTDQNFKDSVDAVANIVRLGGDVDGVVNSANFATNVTNKVIKNVKNVTVDGVDAIKAVDTKPASVAIMNKIARLNPTDITEFQSLAKKTPGQYLVDTGNFGTPDKIISTEASKFVRSKGMVDTELSKLPGVYKNGAVEDALKSLKETAKNVSSDNVPATYLEQVNNLVQKYNAGGLTMDEINNVKRLFERNVKLGYNKLLNPDKVAQATNIDNAIRTWQVQKAKDLGFTNIGDMNRQTQLSKFIVDKLGDKVVGQSALNSVGLTDWIVLANGSPEAVAGFLTKKFFSSRTVQAKIAELLNVGQPVKQIIEPSVNPTVENTLRTQFPQGNLLELPAGRSPVKESKVPINLRGPSTIEPPAQKIFNSSSKPAQPPVLEKSQISSPNNSTKIPNSQGGFVNLEKIVKDAKAFLKTTPEYGLLKDLEAFRELYDMGTMPKGETNKLRFKKEVREQLSKRGVPAFDMTDRSIANFADVVLSEANKVPTKTIKK